MTVTHPHSHVSGLGFEIINKQIRAKEGDCGLNRHESARRILATVAEGLYQQQLDHQLCIVRGPPSSGKSALIYALVRDLTSPSNKSHNFPIVRLGSSDFRDTRPFVNWNRLQRSLRQAVQVSIHEVKEVFEGQVIELTLHPLPSSSSPNAQPSSPSDAVGSITMTLRADKGTQKVTLDPSIYPQLLREHISVNDIVRLEANLGAIKRLGRSDSCRYEYDLEKDTYLPIPKGSVRKIHEVHHLITLDELDQANLEHNQVRLDDENFMAKMYLIRHQVDSQIMKMITGDNNGEEDKKGKSVLVYGLVIIENVHLLDVKLQEAIAAAIHARRFCPCIMVTALSDVDEEDRRSTIHPSLLNDSLVITLEALTTDQMHLDSPVNI